MKNTFFLSSEQALCFILDEIFHVHGCGHDSDCVSWCKSEPAHCYFFRCVCSGNMQCLSFSLQYLFSLNVFLWCLTNYFLIYSIPNKDIVLQGAVINRLYDTNQFFQYCKKNIRHLKFNLFHFFTCMPLLFFFFLRGLLYIYIQIEYARLCYDFFQF